nr:uncharacterized protein LOC116650659 [Drosophila virilis]
MSSNRMALLVKAEHRTAPQPTAPCHCQNIHPQFNIDTKCRPLSLSLAPARRWMVEGSDPEPGGHDSDSDIATQHPMPASQVQVQSQLRSTNSLYVWSWTGQK